MHVHAVYLVILQAKNVLQMTTCMHKAASVGVIVRLSPCMQGAGLNVAVRQLLNCLALW